MLQQVRVWRGRGVLSVTAGKSVDLERARCPLCYSR